jgi:tetratricopeptide (TPR) repeat protein
MYTDYLAQSQVLLEAGLLQEALTPLNVGIALYPQEPELWFAKYKILKALGSPEAWHALTECRRWGPDFLPALTAAYEELLQQRRLREAYQLLETILQKSPDNPRWWVHKAFWALNFGDNATAEQALQKASELPYQPPEVLFYRSLFLARLGKTDEARHLLEKCLQEDPSLRPEVHQEPILAALLTEKS